MIVAIMVTVDTARRWGVGDGDAGRPRVNCTCRCCCCCCCYCYCSYCKFNLVMCKISNNFLQINKRPPHVAPIDSRCSNSNKNNKYVFVCLCECWTSSGLGPFPSGVQATFVNEFVCLLHISSRLLGALFIVGIVANDVATAVAVAVAAASV